MKNEKGTGNSGIKHIIMISVDNLRWDCIGPYKGRNFNKNYIVESAPRTEGIDTLIENGTYFPNCISAAPYTTASHGAILTGFWPLNNHVYEYYNRKLSKPTIFEFAKANGYVTIFQTDFPIILGGAIGFSKAVDHYFIENEDEAFECLLKNKLVNTISFFHFAGVHYPYGFHKIKFSGKDYLHKVIALENRFHVDGESYLEDMLDEAFRDKDDKILLFRYKRIIEKLYSEEKYNDLFGLYIEGIEYFMKRRFEKILKKLLDFIANQNSILVVFSDHGEEWTKDSYGHYNSISENVIRVPLIFYGRNIPKRVVENVVRTVDITPTIMKMIFNNVKIETDGIPLGVFDPNSEYKEDIPAFSQVWIDPDKKKILNHQQTIVKKGKMVKPLKTCKIAESVFYKKYRYVRFFDQNGVLTKEVITDIYGDTIQNTPKKLKSKLGEFLDDYNKNIPFSHETKKIEEVPKNIKNELKLLGYRI